MPKPCRLFKEFAAQMVPRLFPDLPAWRLGGGAGLPPLS
jgi:hypothetical protein